MDAALSPWIPSFEYAHAVSMKLPGYASVLSAVTHYGRVCVPLPCASSCLLLIPICTRWRGITQRLVHFVQIVTVREQLLAQLLQRPRPKVPDRKQLIGLQCHNLADPFNLPATQGV